MRRNFDDNFDAFPTLASKLDAAGNAAAAITVAAETENYWVLDFISWSYSAAPTGGKLTVTINAVSVYEVDITAAGPGVIDFAHHPLYTGVKNQALVVTLAAGGGTVVGKVNIRYR